MRLFLAIDLPDDVKSRVISISSQLKEYIQAKFVEPENMHITLKFLGEVSDIKILESLKSIKFRRFHASLSRIGFFPNQNYIRIIWLGLNAGAIETKRLHDEIESRIPFPKDADFHPHITLARVKSKVDDNARRFLSSAKLDADFDVNSFTLYKSVLTASGPVYEQLAVYPSQPLSRTSGPGTS